MSTVLTAMNLPVSEPQPCDPRICLPPVSNGVRRSQT